MYPGPDDPDLGVFVANLERELAGRGHEFARAVVDRRTGGRGRHLGLARDALRTARQFRPDVVYAHFLVPAGLVAALSSRAPLVVTAHGQDVANIGVVPGARMATRYVVRRATAVVAVSEWLKHQLEDAIPQAAGKTEVVDCGVDLERFAPRDADEARTRSRLARRGNLVSVSRRAHGTEERSPSRARIRAARRGDAGFRGRRPAPRGARRPHRNPSRRQSEPRTGSSLGGSVRRPVPAEPRGAVRPCNARGDGVGRSVVATNVGGPPEFVTPEAGVLVDPLDERALVSALSQAAALPRPNLAGRDAAKDHDVRLQAERVEAILVRAARGRRA